MREVLDTFWRLSPMLSHVFALITGYMAISALFPVRKYSTLHHFVLTLLFTGVLLYDVAHAIEFSPGVRIDARFLIIGTAEIFGGPVTATLAVLSAIAYRMTLGGTAMAGGATMVISLVSFILLDYFLLRESRRTGQLPPPKRRVLIAVGGMLISTLASPVVFHLHPGEAQAIPWPAGLVLAGLVYQVLTIALVFGVLLPQHQQATAYQKLAKSEAELRGILTAMPDTLLTFDRAGTILGAEKHSPGAWFPDVSNMVGRRLSELLPAETATGLMTDLTAVFQGSAVVDRQVTVQHDSGLIYYDVRGVRLDDSRGLAVVRDVTDRVQQEEQLSGARAKLELLANNMQDMVGLLEPDGTISYATPSCQRMENFGVQMAHVDSWSNVLSDADMDRTQQAIAAVRDGLQVEAQLEIRAHQKQTGKTVWLSTRYSQVTRNGVRTGQVLFQGRNVTEVRELERRARLAEMAVQYLTDGVVVTRARDESVVWTNRGFLLLSGHGEGDVVGKTVDFLLNSFPLQGPEAKAAALETSGTWSGELLSQRRDGSWFPEWRHISAFENPMDGDRYYVKIMRDLSQERSQQETLYSLKHRDALTGLPNRGHFVSTLKARVEQAAKESGSLAVAFIGLSGFDSITKEHGRAVADRLLKLVAVRLRAKVGETAPLARVDTNVFALLIDGSVPVPILTRNLRMIVAQFDSPFQVDRQSIHLRANVGVTRSPEDASTAEALLHKSQRALDTAHGKGSGEVVLFEQESAETGLRRVYLETALRKTLFGDATELQLEYQPRVDLATSEVLGFEALLRWHHPEYGQVSPDEVIPMAEESGLIHFLGGWVFETVCEQLALWRDAGFVLKPVSVNLSVCQMQDEKLPQRLAEAARKYNVDPELIDLEVPESEVMNDLTLTAPMLGQLRKLGFNLALDDFGTGYSTMSSLLRVPLDILKLDNSFVRDLGQNRESEIVVRELVSMAKSLELRTVAEGVETEEQRQFLRSIGCQAMQGYLFSAAVPPHTARQWLDQRPALLSGIRPGGSLRF
jgi:diguanylate cyclase (GGDEF)-like protein/PAS domain S-box-containing protein